MSNNDRIETIEQRQQVRNILDPEYQRQMLEEIKDEEEEDPQRAHICTEDSPIKDCCNNKTIGYVNFSSLNDKDVISIVHPTEDGYTVECYTVEEIEKLSNPENQVFIWDGPDASEDRYKTLCKNIKYNDIGKAIPYLPVFKLAYSGIWIDFMSMIILKRYRLFVRGESYVHK